jgi:3-deoxy-manno-octulosonate cytidylyltransferase (CMP-KDO synthetase)
MKIVGVIPARYGSSRFPGKPLADICGKPMVWWVYQQALKAERLSDVYVATDDDRIKQVCEQYHMNTLMTGNAIPNHIHRIWEITHLIDADYYVSINGDEPLIKPVDIQCVFPKEKISDAPFFCSVYRDLSDPVELMDTANVKIVLGSQGQCLYQSRNPIPFPKASLIYKYKKAIGIECFNKKALDFFVMTPMGILEKIEDIDHLRFLENGIPIYYTRIESESLSVDTPKDLEKVILIMKEYHQED